MSDDADRRFMTDADRRFMSEYQQVPTEFRDTPEPKPGEVWEHYKGGRYIIVGVGYLTEVEASPKRSRGGPQVVYRDTGDKLWIRPYSMWHDIVQSVMRPRFVRVGAVEP